VTRLGELMTANVELRRELYGDAVIGQQTLRLIEIARHQGCAAQLPGSGGAVIGLAPEGEAAWEALVSAYEDEGFRVERVVPDA